MAYFIDYVTAGGKYLQMPSGAASIAAGQNFELEFEIRRFNVTNTRILGASGINGGVRFPTNNSMQLLNTTNAGPTYTVPSNYVDFINYKLTRTDGANVLLSIDGDTPVSFGQAGAFTLNRFLADSGGVSASCQVKFVKLSKDGALTNHWVNTTGTGTQMPDAVGGQPFNQIGTWPAGEAEWVFYDEGGATNAEVDLAKSSVSLIAKAVQSISDSNINFSKSTVQLFGKSLSVESSANAELIKSLIQINSKSIVGVADGSVSFSKSVVNVVAKQIEASTSSAVNAEADLLKSSVSIVGKSLNVSADANIDLSKSLVSLIGKQLGLTNDAIVSLSKSNVQLIGKLLVGNTSTAVDAVVDLIKGTVTLTSKDLTASIGAEANLTKSVVTLSPKQLSIASDANADLLKGVVQLTGKFLSVGDIAYSIPTDRIFFIPVNSVVFNIDANNYVFNIPVNQHIFKINEGN